jgi:hypothetical protein
MTKIPNVFHRAASALSRVLVIGYWELGFICYLVLGIWNFSVGGSTQKS